MSYTHAIPLLLSILVGLVLGLMAWELLRYRKQALDITQMGTRNDLLLGLLVLAAFGLGVFTTYILIGAY